MLKSSANHQDGQNTLQGLLPHWGKVALVCTTLLLTACVNTSGHQSRSQDTAQVKPPKSLVPQPPPGGFSSLFSSAPKREPAASSSAAVVSSGIAPDSAPIAKAIQGEEAATWISRYPALAKEYEQYRSELEKEYRQYEQKVQNLKQKDVLQHQK